MCLQGHNSVTKSTRAVVPNRGAAVPWGAICNTQGCCELIRFLLYHWKDIFKISPKLNPNCYGFATRFWKLYLCFVGCRKPKKVGNHCIRESFKRSKHSASLRVCNEKKFFGFGFFVSSIISGVVFGLFGSIHLALEASGGEPMARVPKVALQAVSVGTRTVTSVQSLLPER